MATAVPTSLPRPEAGGIMEGGNRPETEKETKNCVFVTEGMIDFCRKGGLSWN